MYFATPNTWAAAIPETHPLIPSSASYVAYLLATSGTLDVSFHEFSVPIFQATAATPTYTIGPNDTGAASQAAIDAGGWNLNVPVPSDARPAGFGYAGYPGAYDRHMVIVRQDLNLAWDWFFCDGFPGGPYISQRIKRWDLTTPGIDSPSTNGNCRAAPVPLLHTLVTYAEMQAGLIPHAVAFATSRISTVSGIYPCEGSSVGFHGDTFAPRYGFRFRIKRSVNIAALGLSAAGLIVARAIQDYGMILVDLLGGPHGFYVESLDYDATRLWGSTWTSHGLSAVLANLELVEPVGAGNPGGGIQAEDEPPPATPPGPAIPPSVGVVDSAPSLQYRETYDILGAATIKGSRSTIDIISAMPAETFNTVDYRYAQCYATQEFAGHGQHINEADRAELEEEERTDLELKFVRDPTTARWAARQRARFFQLRSYDLEFSLDAPRNIDRIEIGDTVGIDYYGGIGGAWVNEPFFVYGIRYMLDELRYVIRARRIIPEEEVAPASSDIAIGRWRYNSRVGPFFESGSRSVFLVLLDTQVVGGKRLIVLRSTDMGATFASVGTFTALANEIGSFDVHRVGTTLHVATQEAVTGRVAYHTFGLLTSEWTLLNQERYAGNAFGDYGVSITVRSGGGQLIWFQSARATITSTTWPAAPGNYKRTAATWRNPVDDTWSTPIEIGDPSSAASSFTGPHAYHGSVHDNVGRAAAGDNDVVRFVYGRTEPLDVASTPDFHIQRLTGANTLGPNVEFQFTALMGYSAQFVAGDYSVFRAPSMDSGGPVVTEPLCGCESCITTSPLPDTGGDLWIAMPIGYGMNPVIYFWRDSDALDIPHHYAELSTTIVSQHVFEAAFPAIALRYMQGRLYALFGDVGTNPTHAVLKNVISPFTTVDVDPPYASEPHSDQVGPDYPSPGFIQMVGMDLGEINGHLWLFHVSTPGGVGFHFESSQID